MIQHYRAETDIVDHCNLRCKNCCHQSPKAARRFYQLDNFKRDVDALAAVIHYETFAVLGGEPLLNPDCLQYIRYIKSSGLTDRAELITNGLLFPHHPDADRIVAASDIVWVSRYEALGADRLEALDAWCATQDPNVVKIIHKPEFWEMYHPEGQTAKETLAGHTNCDQWQICNLLYHGFMYPCAAAARWQNQKVAPIRVDLHAPELELRMRHFLEGLKVFPPSTCSICQRRKLVPHAFDL